MTLSSRDARAVVPLVSSAFWPTSAVRVPSIAQDDPTDRARQERESLNPVPDSLPTLDRAPPALHGPKKAGLAALSPEAERQRRRRSRLKDNRIQLTVEPDLRLIEAMIAVGAITEAESLRRRSVEAALSEMIDDWTRRVLYSGE